jgi:hypothetical protein
MAPIVHDPGCRFGAYGHHCTQQCLARNHDAWRKAAAPPARLVRDENGEPVMELRERDSAGRFTTPWYAYIWEPIPEPQRGESDQA